ncbi:MAG TPA: TlpA disulfide reductase family protein [Bryobacteraceae bacterium]|nr:TlpA disulfide reductase family protein [Bryobacteraceae bacterium]HOL71681.1 TlpA disulfide reductase family protein [Bryobacteraceae bacterium]HOQ43875.1 TlpA disulfide reductase family protein [Bryobacteraceae bacterium]HPQ17236.1 TlpA disulfide reductase family protein [Bryobacteraceae bacterium]HPU71682.1 TlpA disulfide reductase family protein [Bryobacteraceae bacterium]
MASVKTENVLRGLIVICLAVLVWVVAGTFRERVVVAGDKAPDFSIVTDSGHTITRSNFGGKLLVLNFWATWCPPCIEEIPSLNEFQKRFAADGVVVLGVSVDQNPRAYQNFLSRVNVAFLTARDPEAKISTEYGTFKYPETYIINRDGRVVEKIIGATNWTDEAMMTRVKALLAS